VSSARSSNGCGYQRSNARSRKPSTSLDVYDLYLRALAKDGALPPCVDDPRIYTQVLSGDFVADAKIAWRDAYDMQMRAAVRPLQRAAE
jgi:hypothetical protein